VQVITRSAGDYFWLVISAEISLLTTMHATSNRSKLTCLTAFLLLGCGHLATAENRLLPLPDSDADSARDRPTLEAAVTSGVEWLLSKQREDGAWGTAWKCGMTGLALQAIASNTKVPDEATKGAKYLVEISKKNAGFLSEMVATNHHCVYENALALQGLVEFTTSGGDVPGLRAAMENCAKIIINAQQASGGWAYGEGSNTYVKDREDISVTWWTYHALKSLSLRAVKLDGLTGALKKAEAYIVAKIQSPGGIGHHTNRGRAYGVYTMTGPGLSVLTRSKAGGPKVVSVANWLRDEYRKDPPEWDKNANLYTWYGSTMAFRFTTPELWQGWKQMIGPEILKHQKQDGSWSAETSTFPTASSAAGGADAEIYRTCLCLLMLETMGEPAK
jgi:hypothetical protein